MLFQDQLILSRLQISYRCHCVVVLRIALHHSMISCPLAFYFVFFGLLESEQFRACCIAFWIDIYEGLWWPCGRLGHSSSGFL